LQSSLARFQLDQWFKKRKLKTVMTFYTLSASCFLCVLCWSEIHNKVEIQRCQKGGSLFLIFFSETICSIGIKRGIASRISCFSLLIGIMQKKQGCKWYQWPFQASLISIVTAELVKAIKNRPHFFVNCLISFVYFPSTKTYTF
jgi:hypothetical protein